LQGFAWPTPADLAIVALVVFLVTSFAGKRPFLFLPALASAKSFRPRLKDRTPKESAQTLPIFLPFPKMDALKSAASGKNG